MKICFVCSEYPPGPHGGIGSLVQTLARAMSRRGHRVRVIGVCARSYPAPDFEEDEGVQVWRLREPVHRLGWVKARWQLFRTLSEWCKRGEIEVIEVPDYQGWAAGWPRLRAPVVVRLSGAHTFVSSEQGLPVSAMVRRLEKATLLRADSWSSVSHYLAEGIKTVFSLPTGPDAIIYNPVPLPEQVEHCTRNPFRVVFAGTLNTNKGILTLIEAWPKVKATHGAAELHIYGKDWRYEDGTMMRDFIRYNYPLASGKDVIFHGMVNRGELANAFRSAGVAVFPSKVESFGLAAAEAMAWGCPTIYTRCGSGPEVIDHGRDGWLINPDSSTDIASAINQLISNRALAARLGAAGRKKVQDRFSLQVLLPQNEAFFASSLERFKFNQAQRLSYTTNG